MRALTLHQPWASMIIDGPKRLENRPRRTNVRGWVAVHASQSWSHEYEVGVWRFCKERGLLTDSIREILQRVPVQGGIIGAMHIDDCISASDDPWFMGPHAYVITQVVKLPFFACRGFQGFFNVDLPPASQALIPHI